MHTEGASSSRWMFVVSGFIMNLCLGAIYAWSVFRPSLHQAPYNLTVSESIVPFSICLLLFGFTFAFSGKMVRDVGPRRPALIGAALSGIGYLFCYAIAIVPKSTLIVTIVGFGLVLGAGCGFAYNPTIAVVERWFPDKRGMAIGLTVMGLGLSALVMAPAVVAMVSIIGLPNTFLILGLLSLIVLMIFGLLLRFPSTEWTAPFPLSSTTLKSWKEAANDFDVRGMIKTRTFYFTWFIFLIGGGGGLMVIGYAEQIGTDITGLRGSLEWLAVLAVSLLAVSNAVGRPFFGSLLDRIGQKKTLVMVEGIQLLCLLGLFPYARSAFILYAAIILFGATYGAYLAVMPALTSYYFGTKNLSSNYGLYLIANSVGGVVMPMLMAVILGPKPTYESYVQGFHAIAGLILFAMVLSFALEAPHA